MLYLTWTHIKQPLYPCFEQLIHFEYLQHLIFRNYLQDQFQYAQSQSPLLNEFWVEKARQCLNKPFVGGTPAGPGVTGNGDGPSDCVVIEDETYCGTSF